MNRRNFIKKISIGVGLLSILSIFTKAIKRDVYISFKGNDDTGNGSQKKPYRTINKGLNTPNVKTIIFSDCDIYTEGIKIA